MLDIALYNPRQHRQIQHARGPLVLARAAGAAPVWMPVDQSRAEEAEALVEILAAEDGITLSMAGCERECFCGKDCGLTGNCRLQVPARFAIGDTQFEIVDPTRAKPAPRRPLERLHAANNGDTCVSDAFVNARRTTAEASDTVDQCGATSSGDKTN
jgi:hypothetical protein